MMRDIQIILPVIHSSFLVVEQNLVPERKHPLSTDPAALNLPQALLGKSEGFIYPMYWIKKTKKKVENWGTAMIYNTDYGIDDASVV